MKVRNLVPWGGHEFNFVADDIIDLPDDIAKARLEAGYVAPCDQAADVTATWPVAPAAEVAGEQTDLQTGAQAAGEQTAAQTGEQAGDAAGEQASAKASKK